MLLLGLTGSIATGKSTVSRLLTSPPYSLPLIDADLLARRVVEPGTYAYRKIVAHFGPTTPDLLVEDPDGKYKRHGAPLNRPVLGRRVFGDSPERARDRKVLNGIVHPMVRLAMVRELVWHYLRGSWAVVLDIPLLFESGLDVFCGTVVVVAVRDPAVQMQRLRSRDVHLSEEDAKNRVSSQVDVRVKAERAEGRGKGRGYVIWNDGGREELNQQVSQVATDIKGRSPRWWGWTLLACPPAMGFVAVWEVARAWFARRAWMRENARRKGGAGSEMAKPKL